MKIRLGFVSNSSSSSFVCWGISIDSIPVTDETWLKEYNKLIENKQKYIEEYESSKISKDTWSTRWYNDAIKLLEKTRDFSTDEIKIDFVKNYYDNDNQNLIDPGDLDMGGNGEGEGIYIGLEPKTFMKKYPEIRFSEVKSFVAKKLNEQFNMNITEKDIQYTEQGWYNG